MKKLIIILCLISCNKPEPKTTTVISYETDSHFINGQILPPDEVHLNTLIVINADSLNYWLSNYDVSCNGDVLDLLQLYTVPK